jgi:hypothetical protein
MFCPAARAACTATSISLDLATSHTVHKYDFMGDTYGIEASDSCLPLAMKQGVRNTGLGLPTDPPVLALQLDE